MATQKNITFVKGDDPTATITVTRDGAAFNLTSRRIEVLVKATRYTDDASKLFQLSSVGGSPKVTITNAAGGLGLADFADQFNSLAPGVYWYRAWTALSADEGSDRQTFNYGELVVEPA